MMCEESTEYLLPNERYYDEIKLFLKPARMLKQ